MNPLLPPAWAVALPGPRMWAANAVSGKTGRTFVVPFGRSFHPEANRRSKAAKARRRAVKARRKAAARARRITLETRR